MLKVFMLFTLLFLASYTHILHSAEFSLDAPEYTRDSTVPFKTADSYEQALHIWKTPISHTTWRERCGFLKPKEQRMSSS